MTAIAICTANPGHSYNSAALSRCPFCALKRALSVTRIIADLIREVGEVPTATLYAALCGVLTLSDFNSMLAMLQRAELVSVSNHVARWIGPEIVK